MQPIANKNKMKTEEKPEKPASFFISMNFK